MEQNRPALISAIILAAGESKRMGQLKQLMPFGESTILEQTIDNLLNTAVNETIVVLGFKADEVKKAINVKPVKIAVNPDYKQGMSTSIIAGLNMVDHRSKAVIIALGDQPLVDSQTINNLIESFVDNEKGMAIPVYQGRRGNPVIFDIKYKDELLKLQGDIGGREIVKHHQDDVLEVTVDCEGVCVDIDTMDGYNWK